MNDSQYHISSSPDKFSQDRNIIANFDGFGVPGATHKEPRRSSDKVFSESNQESNELQYKYVIAHVDRIVVTIPIDRKNVPTLIESFENIKRQLAIMFMGNEKYKFKRTGKKKDVLQFEFKNEFSKIKWRLPKPLNKFFLKNKRYPNFREIEKLKYMGSWLALIEIIDRQKRNPACHVENVLKTIDFLDTYFNIECKTLEIALDTRCQEFGNLLRKCACLFRPPGDISLFHFERVPGQKKPKLIPGPSKDGNNEYHGYRPKSWNDNRPNSVRPRGGRRQINSYDRIVRLGNKVQYTFPRLELRLFRDYIREYMRHNNLNVKELLMEIEKLVKDNLVLREIDRNKLYIDRPGAEFWKLKDYSTKGQIYRLHEKKMTNKDIRPYLKKVEWPPISYIVDPRNSEREISDYEFYYWEDINRQAITSVSYASRNMLTTVHMAAFPVSRRQINNNPDIIPSPFSKKQKENKTHMRKTPASGACFLEHTARKRLSVEPTIRQPKCGLAATNDCDLSPPTIQ